MNCVWLDDHRDARIGQAWHDYHISVLAMSGLQKAHEMHHGVGERQLYLYLPEGFMQRLP